MATVAFSSDDGVDLALAIFLIAVGLALAYAFIVLGVTLGRISRFIRRTEEEMLPMIEEAGGTVRRVNRELDKVGEMTSSAAAAIASVDRAVRGVSSVVMAPVEKLSGLAAGVTHGVSSFRAHGDWGEAVKAGKEASARREADVREDLAGAAGGDGAETTAGQPPADYDMAENDRP